MSMALLVLTIALMTGGAICFVITSVTKQTISDVVGLCLLTTGGVSGAVYAAIVSL